MVKRMDRMVHGTRVVGIDVDEATRCGHYHTDVDVIAIRFPCCDTYYPCRECHDAVADHPAQVWGKEQFGERAILCGACGEQLTVSGYLEAQDHCPACDHGFNPGCSLHYDLYFDV